ncbi:MAG: hypothetical protein ABIP51_15190 [Bacteroidia bacterium]
MIIGLNLLNITTIINKEDNFTFKKNEKKFVLPFDLIRDIGFYSNIDAESEILHIILSEFNLTSTDYLNAIKNYIEKSINFEKFYDLENG